MIVKYDIIFMYINRIPANILIKITLEYSAIKSIAKPAPPYSILNPDTSSDSPSTKSKGARFVSAILVIIHISMISGIKISIGN